MTAAPLIVEVTRGPAVESRHAVHAVAMNGRGDVVAAFGDPRRPTFPRSAIKPLQALALAESGAAEAFHLSEAELALACASHSGEGKHTAAVAAWLRRLGLDETALECGAHAPYAAPESPPTVLCNNCSGKHAGMVTLSMFLKKDFAGYTNFLHPVQQTIFKAMGEMCGVGITPEICGVDGCSAPNPCLSLENIARGFAAFMTRRGLSPVRAAACRRVFGAMTHYPELVGGTGRLDTLLMRAAQGKVLSKTGAEGVYACIAPEKDMVIVLKAEDGAKRAAEAALYALLEKFHIVDASVLEAINPLVLPVLKNWRGIETGAIRV
ncbi:MAG: asparaginase [Alphaproteobacteria bacterium]|nr:asparaginase [Alphaproteobacteria bacterium]